MNTPRVGAWIVALSLAATVSAKEPIRLASDPALSPDGQTLAFSWRGEIWTAPIAGWGAKQLTRHSADDTQPEFSPDGSRIAFVSERSGSNQVFVMPSGGGAPQQLTHHTEGYNLQGWYPDGHALLTSGQRDHFWRSAERFYKVNSEQRTAEELLFDDYGASGALSPDGKRLLFTREGPAWWRKGYYGSQAAQVWMFEPEAKVFTKLLGHDRGCLWPLWKPDGKGFYYVGGQSGSFNLWEYNLETKAERQITRMADDSVAFPCISRDGSTIVFRHLFDFYRLNPASESSPQKIELYDDGDAVSEPVLRRRLSQATEVAFSHDGLDIAFIAGGDLWVMDTELREPKQVTSTPEEERDPVFSTDGETLWFVSDAEGQADIWRASRADAKKFWWLNDKFPLTRVTQDGEVERNLKFSPDGGRVAYQRGHGELWTVAKDGADAKRMLASWSPPQFDWSPDGKWMVYAHSDSDFNSDVWIAPLDGSREPFNLSRHPDNEFAPAWSPDGKAIAFTGRRVGDEVDVYFVWLQEQDEEKRTRDRTLERAMEKVTKVRSGRGGTITSPSGRSFTPPPGFSGRFGRPGGAGAATAPPSSTEPSDPNAPAATTTPTPAPTAAPARPAEVKIDWEGIHDRMHRISIPNSTEGGLVWSADGKKLAFSAAVESRRGTYYVEVAENTTPRLLATQTGSNARWISQGDQIVWLSSGVPASLSSGGRSSDYRFSAYQEVNRPAKHRAAFELAWRTMRDSFYDERLGNRNWDAIRRKYTDMAAGCTDETSLATVINLMLGELNGSHLGFSPSRGSISRFEPPTAPPATPTPTPPATPAPPGVPTPTPAPPTIPTRPTFTGNTGGSWQVSTAHLGVRFDPSHKGPGLLVRDVIFGTPADDEKSKLRAGDTILSIDGTTVDPGIDLTRVLNGRSDREIRLQVKNAEGSEREVSLRPTSHALIRERLYEKWVRDNRTMIDKLSNNTLGYLHIRAMNQASFDKFEEDLYAAGAGKSGLVIDVRNNGGGSTTDHLLTALTQPVHAITVPRGGSPGYPQDRKVYATWQKPIVVLCNQNSFSNAEIFSHAIKTLGRGQLVGVPTAGGVISTGSAAIMDVGTLRLPGRGWYVLGTGEDMELNGAVPQHVVWLQPGDQAAGKDSQIDKAVEVLLADVKAFASRPQPKLRKATERGQETTPAGGESGSR